MKCPLPVSLAANPNLSSWVRFTADGTVALSPGKVEIGQGIVTALAQIAADELDVDIGRMRDEARVDRRKPERGRHLGQPVDAAVGARNSACLRRDPADASSQPQRSVSALTRARSMIDDGMISGPGNVRTSYWELAGDVSLDRDASAGASRSPRPHAMARPFRPADRYSGQGVRATALHPRSGIAGLLHGRVLRPDISGAKLIALDETAPRAVPGLVAIVRDGGFAGVVADSEAAAEAALKALRKGATWSAGEPLPDEDDLAAF